MKRATLPALLLLTCLATTEFLPAEGMPTDSVIPAEDYALYDLTVETKFLTSRHKLVVIERMTVARLLPGRTEPITIGLFQDGNYFMGLLPPDLVRDFIETNREAGRLEGRFQFGVRYRFVTGDSIEEPEVSAAVPVKTGRAAPVQDVPVLERLAFSRVGRTIRNDQALLYVEQMRPDGTGAGFLVWFHQRGREWTVFDTDVVWTVGEEKWPDGSP